MSNTKIAVNSMTAFARVQGDNEWGSYAWELRSVNHRYLEAQFKLPEKLKALEPGLRGKLRSFLARGKVECSLYFKVSDTEQALNLNHKNIIALLQTSQVLHDQHKVTTTLTAHEILQWPGVLQADELDTTELTQSLLDSFEVAMQKLVEARQTEGARLAALITERLVQIEQIVEGVKKRLPELLNEHQLRLEVRIKELGVELDRDRLTQEIVLLAQKVDVAEELDRLEAHVAEVRDTLLKSEPCGRRLDFLMQELNREANTLGSKSMAVDTSQGAINLKVLIEQMREQVQNIE